MQKKEAFAIDRQFVISDDMTEVGGRALTDISLGDELSIVRKNGTSVYIVQKLEAYRKPVEILYAIYGGIIWLKLSDGPGCDFTENDILFSSLPDKQISGE